MSKALVKGGLLGGLTLFLWGALSWTVLPWHDMATNTFTNEDLMAQAIVANAPRPGVYFMPNAYQIPALTPPAKRVKDTKPFAGKR